MEISPTTPVIHYPDDRSLKRRQPGLWLFVALALAYILTASGRIDSGDGQVIFDVSQRLLEHGSVALPPPNPDRIAFDPQGRPRGKAEELGIPDSYRTPGRAGRYYSPTGLGHSLLLVPFLVLGKAIALITQANTSQWVMEFVAAMLFNPLVSATSGFLIYLLGRRLSFSPKKSLALAIIYAFGTMTWVYAKSFASDPLIALFLLLAFYSLVSYRYTQRLTWLWIGGTSLGFAVLTKPFSLITTPIFFIYLLLIVKDKPLRDMVTRVTILTIPFIIGVAITMAYNWWRFESPFDVGYRDTFWSVPFLTGLYGLTLSPGKSYLLYNPIVIGAIAGSPIFWRRHKLEAGLILGFIVISLLGLAKYDHWHGGGCWGPRLLLPITPFIILPLGSLLEVVPLQRSLNGLLVPLIAVSLVVQIPGISVNYIRFLQKVYELSVEQFYQRVTFEITYSPLIGQWVELRQVIHNFREPAQRAIISQIAFHDTVDPSEAIDLLSANLPDFWFIYLDFIWNYL